MKSLRDSKKFKEVENLNRSQILVACLKWAISVKIYISKSLGFQGLYCVKEVCISGADYTLIYGSQCVRSIIDLTHRQSIIDDNHELNRTFKSTNLDEYELIDFQ